MKKKIDIYSALTVLTLGMIFSASCGIIDGERPDDVDTAFKDDYVMAVRIYDTAAAGYGTRADSEFDSNEANVGSGEYVFNKGLESERAIWPGTGIELFQTTPHFMFFFDADGKKIGDALKLSKYNPSEIDETPEDYSSFTTLIAYTKEDDPVQKFGTGKVLVVLNASQYIRSELQKLDTYEDMTGLLCKPQNAGGDSSDYLYLDDKGNRYFTMTSSMIVTDGQVGPASAPINPKWYKNETDARLNPSYEMYVERPHVKYTLLFKNGNNDWSYLSETETDNVNYTYHPVKNFVYSSTKDLKSEDYKKLRCVSSYVPSTSIEERNELSIVEADWKVNISGWGINATERNEYLFKQIQNSEYYNGWNPDTYSNRRTFWAEDENYATGNYPDQYRSVKGVSGLEGMTSSLDYFSYNKFTTQKNTHIYSPENTFSVGVFGDNLKEAYDSKAYLRTGTHVIVAAQLLIDGFDAVGVYAATEFNADGLAVSGTTSKAADKYCMNGIYWSEIAYKNYVMEYLGYWMLSESNKDKFRSVDGSFYVDANGTPASGNDFTAESVSIKGGDSYVWVRPSETTTLYVKTAENTYEPLPLKSTSIDAANYTDLALEHQEYFASHFAEGRMYYAIPVKHNLSRASTESAPIAIGDYGAVRNHWYFFEVDGVMAPGTAVDVPEQKIVPNNEPEEIGLGVNISILDWHRIKIEDVDVSGQPRPQPTNPAN